MEKLITIIKNVPSFSNTPDNVIIALVAALAVVGVFFFFIMILIVTGYNPVEGMRRRDIEEPAPTHKAIIDLKEALVEEMKGTSRQNSIMIWLTIIFITISVLGIIATLMGPERIASMTDSILSLFSRSGVPK